MSLSLSSCVDLFHIFKLSHHLSVVFYISILFWLLLHFKGLVLEERFPTFKYGVYLLSTFLKVFFFGFLLYRLYYNQSLLMLFEEHLYYFLVLISIICWVTLIYGKQSIYNVPQFVFLSLGLVLAVGLVGQLLVFNWTVYQGYSLLKQGGAVTLYLGFASSFHTLNLICEGPINEKTLRFLLGSVLLLSLSSFFAPYNGNIFAGLMPSIGYYMTTMIILSVQRYRSNRVFLYTMLGLF